MLQSSHMLNNLCSIKDVKNYLQRSFQGLEFELKNPPYIQLIYHPLRIKIIQNYKPLQQVQTLQEYKEILQQLVLVIDDEYLNKFQLLLIQPFKQIVLSKQYGIPKNIEIGKAQEGEESNKALQQLVYSVVQWNIQVEIFLDHLQRIDLYQQPLKNKDFECLFWEAQKKQTQGEISVLIKSFLQPSYDLNFKSFTRDILKKLLVGGVNKFNSLLQDTANSKQHITFGAVMVIAHAIFGAAAIPLNVLNLQWLIGGAVGSYFFGRVSQGINNYEQWKQILDITKMFQAIDQNLLELNQLIKKAVDEFLSTQSVEEQEKKQKCLTYFYLDLTNLIENFLNDPDAGKNGTIKDVFRIIENEDIFNIIENEDDDWVIIEKPL